MDNFEIPNWPAAHGRPDGTGKIRVSAVDFIVKEQLAFEPSGAGEHVFLQIEKTGENTDYVARQLAKFASVRLRDIGYAGLKDRHAMTTQWFSVWLPGKPDPDWARFETDAVKVLQVRRHARKLQRGAIVGNAFELVVRDWQGHKAKTDEQLAAIKKEGVPNYFGPQRFGFRGANVGQASNLFQTGKISREKRGIYLSAARSFLFNHVLACRVSHGVWNQAVDGDCFMFDGSHSFFRTDRVDADILSRLERQEIHPTGPLWGKGPWDVSSRALTLEQTIIERYEELASGLIKAGLEMGRRPLRVGARDFDWRWLSGDSLQISFALPPGSYATSVLREIIKLEE
ncbi:MAG: tRNA pseudouridine(13) synthase TruD [Gammaproteobacteria bacterium]